MQSQTKLKKIKKNSHDQDLCNKINLLNKNHKPQQNWKIYEKNHNFFWKNINFIIYFTNTSCPGLLKVRSVGMMKYELVCMAQPYDPCK